MRRILFQEKNSSIWIKIEVYRTEDEEIIVHGHDSGTAVKTIKDRYDYEYYLTIKKEEVQRLIEKLELKNMEELFSWFTENYSTDRAVSQIREQLEKLQIKHHFSTW